jgi:hypothetical protein
MVPLFVASVMLASCGGAAYDGGAIETIAPSAQREQVVTTSAPTRATTTVPIASSTAAAPVTTVSPAESPSTTVPPAGAPVTTAPTTSVGRGASPRLDVSQTTDLDPAGVRVTVRGSGYDPTKGVYVGVCTRAAPSATEATCIGGVDMGGDSPSLAWVSSNPPPYAVGLTQPYEAGGSFVVTLLVVARSGPIDCRAVRCGIITRNDHLRYSDRSQDVFVPISFAG